MEFLSRLQQLFAGYDATEHKKFDASLKEYKAITLRNASFILNYVRDRAKEWAQTINKYPDQDLNSRISALSDFYHDAYNRRERADDNDVTVEYQKLSAAYYFGTIYYAAVLFNECYLKEVTADVFFIDTALIIDALNELAPLPDRKNKARLYSIQSISRRHHVKTHGGRIYDSNTDKYDLFRDYPSAQVYLKRLIPKYLNTDYSLIPKSCSKTLAAVIAHEIGKQCNMTSHNKYFEAFWMIKSLSVYYCNAREFTERSITGKVRPLLEQLYGSNDADSSTSSQRLIEVALKDLRPQ